MSNISFEKENPPEYKLDSTLLNHSRITQHNRAHLFWWLSEECSKQGLSRNTYNHSCRYIDLFFMKKGNIELINFQLLALGALILATKQVQIEGRLPSVNLKQFKLHELLEMERKIVFTLNFYLNPPSYIELLNNLAKMWDLKCQNGIVNSKVRYFTENDISYMRLKTLYEKMDCLNLFKKILSLNIQEVVVTLFYHQTKIFVQELTSLNSNAIPCENPEEQKSFEQTFKHFLRSSEIQTNPQENIEKIIKLLTKQTLPVYPLTDDDIKTRKSYKILNGQNTTGQTTHSEKISYQTHNKNGYQFYKKYYSAIRKL